MIPNQIQIQDDILTLFDSFTSQDSCLMMTKSFHGIMLRQEVMLIEANNHRAVFQLSRPDICPALEGCVHLHCQGLAKSIKARVQDISPNTGMFALADFAYMEKAWQERFYERVSPKNPIYISLRYMSMDLRASILDISISGMGVLVGNSFEPKLEFLPNAGVTANFQLNPLSRRMKLAGAVHYAKEVSRSIMRLGIRLYPKIEQTRDLANYIAERKQEIITELEQAYTSSSAQSRVEYQYF
jgi:hypothetical protein